MVVQWFKNPPSSAGDRFDPWSGKTLYAVKQLSLCPQLLSLHSRTHKLQLLSCCAATAEAHLTRASAAQGKSLQWEAYALQLESSPCSV